MVKELEKSVRKDKQKHQTTSKQARTLVQRAGGIYEG